MAKQNININGLMDKISISNANSCAGLVPLPSYVIFYNQINTILRDCCIQSLINKLNSMAGIPLGSLTIADLLQPLIFDKGIYLFKEGTQYHLMVNNPPNNINLTDCWYIGKCTSRSFQERLGGHLSIQPGNYMNTLIKRIAWVMSNTSYDDFKKKDFKFRETYHHCAADVMKQLNLIFISFKGCSNPKDKIEQLEKCLIDGLHPYLNFPKRGVFKKSKLSIT